MDQAPAASKLRELQSLVGNNPTLDFWRFMGVPPGANAWEVMRAYCTMARELLPDKTRELPQAVQDQRAEQLKLATSIREILVNPVTVEMYTALRAQVTAAPAMPRGVPHLP